MHKLLSSKINYRIIDPFRIKRYDLRYLSTACANGTENGPYLQYWEERTSLKFLLLHP